MKSATKFFKGVAYHQQVNDVNQVMATLLKIAKTYDSVHEYASAFKYGHEQLA